MKKLLLIGINTREMINSAVKLNYEIYSTSYFSTYDTIKLKNEKHILHQEKNKSCGCFEEEYNVNELLELSLEYMDEVDYIIPISGISPSDFKGSFKKYKSKILGNKNVENVENKFRFYKKIKDEFLTPETFHVNDIEEAIEIAKNKKENQYIIKPVQGSGGYGVNLLNKYSANQINDSQKGWLMQEYIEGINLSSSTLSTKSKVKNLVNSRLLIQNDLKNENGFIYIGNILPLDKKSILTKRKEINIEKLNNTMSETSENLIKKLKLIGSNGVDYIFSKKGLYLIEVNPRLQGTYECCESVLKINMLEAHIKACQNELIAINNNYNGYSYKKIIYSKDKLKFKEINLNNIYDIPYPGAIIEKNQPYLTLIENNKDFNDLCKNIEIASNIIKKN